MFSLLRSENLFALGANIRSQGRPWKRVVPTQEEEDESGHPWRCWDGLCRHLRPASIADIADIGISHCQKDGPWKLKDDLPVREMVEFHSKQC